MFLDQYRQLYRILDGRLIHQATQDIVAKQAAFQGDLAGPIDSLSGMFTSQGQHSLQQTVSPDPPFLTSGFRPIESMGADVFRPAE